MTWRRAEAHLAQAAADADIPMVPTGVSSLAAEQAVSIAGNVWFQFYVWEDEQFVDAIVDRLAAAEASSDPEAFV